MSDLTNAEPFQILKRADETDGAFVRILTIMYPSSEVPDDQVALPHRRWAADNVDKHIHPTQEERLAVRRGTYRVVLDGTEHTLTEGEEIVTPPNTPHRHWNPTDRPAQIIKEDRPARHSESFFTALYALAQAGKTGEDGLPSMLQFAVLQDAYPGHAYTTDLPIGVQKVLFSSLAPLGRLLGYEAEVPVGLEAESERR